MRGGVRLLAKDRRIRQAFGLANMAMLMQMVHSAPELGGTPHSPSTAPQNVRPDYPQVTLFLAPIPARFPAAHPRGNRNRKPGSRSSRPHLVPYRRRQDRSISSTSRLHHHAPTADPRRRRRRDDSDNALYAPAANRAAVPARGHDDRCMRDPAERIVPTSSGGGQYLSAYGSAATTARIIMPMPVGCASRSKRARS